MYNKKYVISCFLICMSLCLAGCATDSYHEPSQDAKPTAVSAIKNYYFRKGMIDWQVANVSSIDDKNISYFTRNTNVPIRVMPGAHSLVVDARFNRSFNFDGSYEAFVPVSLMFKAGMIYQVKMQVKGAQVGVWVEDYYGKKVTSISWKEYSSAPKPTTRTIIFIH